MYCEWCIRASELAGKPKICRPCWKKQNVNRAKSGSKKNKK